jgi:metal-responsive CopG/Arc/MetJ family transcriptional regulator
MPSPATARQSVTVKLAKTGVDRIDQLAAEASVDRSEMIRRLLAYAAARMPKGWTPPGR